MSAPAETHTEPRWAQQDQGSYQDYQVLAGETGHAEWVNGEIIAFMPPLVHHQALIAFLMKLVGMFVDLFGTGQLIVAPFELWLTPDGNIREPDLMFIAQDHLDRVMTERINGAPDLIVEIVSDDSMYRDRVDKFDEYEAGGVPEYWIIDNRPGRQRAYFYQLAANGQYLTIPLDESGAYHSRVLPSFWLNVEWLWEMPNTLPLLLQIIGVDRLSKVASQS